MPLAGCISSSSVRPKLVLCGDSTMARYATSERIVGWGEVLDRLVSRDAIITDLAIPGATARSFLEDAFPSALSTHADVALIQFGHNRNDSADEASALDSIARAFKRFGTRTIFVTPMTARNGGQLCPNLNAGIRDAARRNDRPLIPLDQLSLSAWNAAGPDSVSVYFIDPIHLSAPGAFWIARLVAENLIELEPELSP